MIKDYRILLIIGLLGMVFLGLAIHKGFDEDYIRYQKAYYEALGEDFPGPVVKQVNVKTPSSMLVDRCQSCHIGASNPQAKDFEMPLTMHPPIVPGAEEDPHDFNKIGCAVCHDGSSRDLDQHLAHGEAHGWIAPLVSGKIAQANCVRCHAMDSGHLAGAEQFEKGRELFLEKACWGCHTVAGVSTSSQAPELTDAGGKFNFDYLYESIVHPKANDANSKMPEFDWVHDHETVVALATYLKGLQKNKLRSDETAPIGYIKPKPDEVRISDASVDAGRALFAGVRYEGSINRGGCVNCHAFRNDEGQLAGGHIGPELTWSIRNRGETFVKEHIINARTHTPDSIMPTFKDYNEAELDSLVMFLSTFNYTLSEHDEGKKLYDTYCLSCHGEDLNGKGVVSAMLDPYPRDFSRHQFVISYEDRFKHSILKGVAGTAMPAWENVLSEADVQKLIDFIKAKTLDEEKSSFKRLEVSLPKIGEADRRNWKNKGQVIEPGNLEEGAGAFQQYCTSCHGKLANGKGPNAYNLQHPLPRNLLNAAFMNQEGMTDERLYQSILLGVAGTPMPSHDHLSDQTIIDIIAFIRANTEDAE
ncbi:c-type cytochrome [Pontiella sp.]|uniref:c-type cytochrome n=1 Tax=Pontiella sp. TaxID=2837462 RepID=UPI003561D67C